MIYVWCDEESNVGSLSVLETKGAVAPNRAVARPRAPRSGANGAAQRR